MANIENAEELVKKVNKAIGEGKLDLSSDQDLSIGIMNLISIEEHLFFTAQKTGKDSYLKMLNEVREMRKVLLKKIIKDYEGEVWCISKHLLSASMRLMEVGTKALTKGDEKEAKELFAKSYDLYMMFWAINMNLVDSKTGVNVAKIQEESKKENYIMQEVPPAEETRQGFFGKLRGALDKALDCCRE